MDLLREHRLGRLTSSEAIMAASPHTHMSFHIATRSTCLCATVEVADTFLSRLVGLLGRRSLPAGTGLWLRPSTGVHTLGMHFPIDVVSLNADLTVVRLDRKLRPWRIAGLDRRTRSVLELPAGQIDVAKLTVGDLLTIAN